MAKKKKKKSTSVKAIKASKSIPKIEEKHISIDQSFWKKNGVKALLLFVLCGILYFQGIDYGYVLDDKIVISGNQFTSAGTSGIWDIMTNESMTGYFGEQKNLVQGNRYRPLSLVTFAAEVEMFGLSPKAGHIGNIILYGITCVVLFWMLYLLLLQRDKRKNGWLGIAFIASLLYTVHGVHTEAIANIKGRDEIMALLFSLLCLVSVLKYVNTKKLSYIVWTALCFFLGLLSKENTITFLAIIPVSMYFFTSSKKNDYLKVMGVLTITTIVYLILRFSVSGVPSFSHEITDIMNNPFYGMSGAEKLATISFTLLKYIGLSTVPYPLTHDYYPYAIPILNWLDYRAIIGLIVHIALVVLMFKNWKKKSIISYGIFFYLAALSIVSNVVINVGTFMNERFIFISTVGSCLIIAYLLLDKLPKWNASIGKYLGYGLLSVLLIGYSYQTFTRVPVWESALTLNQSAVEVSTNSARANSFMSTALFKAAKTESDRVSKKDMLTRGKKYADKAVELIPNYKNANLMRAGIAGELHKLDNDLPPLLQTFKEVASNRPDIPFVIEYMEYLQGSRISDDDLINFYYDIGYNVLLLQKNKPKWALHYLGKAQEVDKMNAKLNKAIGDTYARVGDTEKANFFYQAAGTR